MRGCLLAHGCMRDCVCGCLERLAHRCQCVGAWIRDTLVDINARIAYVFHSWAVSTNSFVEWCNAASMGNLQREPQSCSVVGEKQSKRHRRKQRYGEFRTRMSDLLGL